MLARLLEAMTFDVDAVRAAFPILGRRIATPDGERPLVYFDHGASTHAPKPVLDAVQDLMTRNYANIHRGHHTLSQESSDLFDATFDTFADFIGAPREKGTIVLSHNTTAALDLAAHILRDVPGHTLTTRMEHHSNDLPHRRAGAVVHAEVDDAGRVDLDDMQRLLDQGGVKLVAVSGASNVTGHTPPIHRIARMAHDAGARILVDAAQLYAHVPIDVKAEGHPEHIDLLAAAGHKAYAPFGSAFLYGPRDLFDAAPPHTPGGGTVDWVTDDGALHNRSPDRHMGGTPNVAGAVAFAAATRFLAGIGMDAVRDHEVALMRHGLRRFAELEEEHGVRLLGPRDPAEKVGVFTFLVPGHRHEEVAARLDRDHGIATRDGCFCAHPLLQRLLGIDDVAAFTRRISRGEDVPLPGATRAALGIYNTEAEVDLLAEALAGIASSEPAPLVPKDAVGARVEVS